MANDPGLQQLLNQFAQCIGLDELELDTNGLCALRFNGTLTVEMSAREDELLLYSDLGPLARPHAATLLADLLQANLFWQATHGATLSLSGDTPPHIILARLCAWRQYTAVQLESFVEEFVATAEEWTERLARNPASAHDVAEPVDTDEAQVSHGGNARHDDPGTWSALRG